MYLFWGSLFFNKDLYNHHTTDVYFDHNFSIDFKDHSLMELNLPAYQVKFRTAEAGKKEIFDDIRKKFVLLTPEEWVRQHFVHYLTDHLGFPASLIAIEKGLTINRMSKRFDAVIYGRNGLPLVLLEFKSPQVKLNQSTFDQIAAYNLKLQVKYLIISNGLEHYCCKMDYSNTSYSFLQEIPFFDQL